MKCGGRSGGGKGRAEPHIWTPTATVLTKPRSAPAATKRQALHRSASTTTGRAYLFLIQPGDDVGFLIGPGEVEGGLDAAAFFRGALPGEAELTKPAGGPDGGVQLGAGDAQGLARGAEKFIQRDAERLGDADEHVGGRFVVLAEPAADIGLADGEGGGGFQLVPAAFGHQGAEILGEVAHGSLESL